MWQISAMLWSVRLHLLFDAKVSKTVNTVFLSTGWCFVVFGRSTSSPLLATCRSIQHALRLCVGMMHGVQGILHGLLNHPSSMVPRPVKGFGFFVIGLGDLRERTLLVWTRGLVRAGGSQNFVWVFQALSIAQYFCTMAAKSVKCTMSRRRMALRIPLSVQFLQKSKTTFSSR